MVIISLLPGSDVTVTEDNEGYAEKTTSKSFRVSESTELVVTNFLSKIVPTGVSTAFAFNLATLLLPIAPIAIILYRRKRHKL